MKEIILTDKAQQPGGMPYSQAIKVGNTVYVAGQGPFELDTGMCNGDTLEYQARRTLENVKAILEAAGAKMSDVVKVTVFMEPLILTSLTSITRSISPPRTLRGRSPA